MDGWAYERRIELDFSRPGKPTVNAKVGSFNGRFRKEYLNVHWLSTGSCRWPTRRAKSKRGGRTMTRRVPTPGWRGRHAPNTPAGRGSPPNRQMQLSRNSPPLAGTETESASESCVAVRRSRVLSYAAHFRLGETPCMHNRRFARRAAIRTVIACDRLPVCVAHGDTAA